MEPADRLLSRIADMVARRPGWLHAYADVAGLLPEHLSRLPRAVSLVVPMDPEVMEGLGQGPTRVYAELYQAVNRELDELCPRIAEAIVEAGWQAHAVASSVRSDPVNIQGEFPHKTAATRAGHGWVGKNSQLIHRRLGPWLRLGTVLCDAPLPAARPVTKSRCGKCTACVDACPAGALHGAAWTPGLPRDEIFSASLCDQYKKEHFMAFNHGHNCGICTSVCPVAPHPKSNA